MVYWYLTETKTFLPFQIFWFGFGFHAANIKWDRPRKFTLDKINILRWKPEKNLEIHWKRWSYLKHFYWSIQFLGRKMAAELRKRQGRHYQLTITMNDTMLPIINRIKRRVLNQNSQFLRYLAGNWRKNENFNWKLVKAIK